MGGGDACVALAHRSKNFTRRLSHMTRGGDACVALAHRRSFPFSTRKLVVPQMTYVTNYAALNKAFDLRTRGPRGRRQAAPCHHIPSDILNRRSNVRKGTHPRLPG